MARTSYKGFNLPDGSEIPDVPADLRTLVDGLQTQLFRINTYNDGVSNGTNTSVDAVWAQHHDIPGLAVPYSMHVLMFGSAGANGAINDGNIKMFDQAGNLIGGQTAAASANTTFKMPTANGLVHLAYRGIQIYAANATCGFRCTYVLNASNIYIGCSFFVLLIAR